MQKKHKTKTVKRRKPAKPAKIAAPEAKTAPEMLDALKGIITAMDTAPQNVGRTDAEAAALVRAKSVTAKVDA